MTATTVLFIGFDPASMDLGDKATELAEQIQAGIDRSMTELASLGYDAEFLPLDEGANVAVPALRARLRANPPDCIVVGAGVRLMPKHTVLFESLVAAVIELAPNAKLAFNATPADAAVAVHRRLAGR